MSLVLKARVGAVLLAACAVVLALSNAPASAHGGEDHSKDKAPVISAGTNSLVHAARAGDLEVAVKHPPFEPGREVTARVFVTRFETNEPVEGANVSVILSGGRAPVEAAAASGETPGLYEVKLPPLPEGEYHLSARVEAGGETQTADYGALRVAPAPAPVAENGSSRARTILLALFGLVAFAFVGLVLYRAAGLARRGRVKGEAAAA